MTTYPIPEYLCGTSDGADWALGVIVGERVVALSYLACIGPASVIDQLDGAGAEFAIRQWLHKSPLELRELQALGDVSVGVVTTDGFVEAWMVEDR